jgi:hypothetical protein
MKIMSSGMSVFFIQKLAQRAGIIGKIMPPFAGRLVRNIRPRACSSAVRATFRDGVFETTLGLNDTFIAGVSQVFCYNPIFGYRLEKFSADGLLPGDVLQSRDGFLNLKNPACYVFPRENGCRPGDRFRADQLEQARKFVAYRPFEFAMPRRQHLANAVSRWSLWLIGALGVVWLAWKSARRFA